MLKVLCLALIALGAQDNPIDRLCYGVLAGTSVVVYFHGVAPLAYCLAHHTFTLPSAIPPTASELQQSGFMCGVFNMFTGCFPCRGAAGRTSRARREAQQENATSSTHVLSAGNITLQICIQYVYLENKLNKESLLTKFEA